MIDNSFFNDNSQQRQDISGRMHTGKKKKKIKRKKRSSAVLWLLAFCFLRGGKEPEFPVHCIGGEGGGGGGGGDGQESYVIQTFFRFFMCSSIGGLAYVTVFNSSATWAGTLRLRGYKCMLVIFMFL